MYGTHDELVLGAVRLEKQLPGLHQAHRAPMHRLCVLGGQCDACLPASFALVTVACHRCFDDSRILWMSLRVSGELGERGTKTKETARAVRWGFDRDPGIRQQPRWPGRKGRAKIFQFLSP